MTFYGTAIFHVLIKESTDPCHIYLAIQCKVNTKEIHLVNTAAKNVIRVVLLFCILLVFYLFGKMSAILHRNPKFALFEKFFSRLERKEFWLSRNIQIYKIAKKFQSMLVRNASFDAIDLGLICPCYSSRSMYRTCAIISRDLHIF